MDWKDGTAYSFRLYVVYYLRGAASLTATSYQLPLFVKIEGNRLYMWILQVQTLRDLRRLYKATSILRLSHSSQAMNG